MAWPAILLLGDSVTQRGFEIGGWASLLADAYVRKADVLNRGFGGYNSQWLLDAMVQHAELLLPQSKMLFICVFLGANDAAANFQGVPVAQYEENLAKIVAVLRSTYGASTRVFLLGPPPVEESEWLLSMRQKGVDATTSNRRNEAVQPYVAAVKRVACSHSCTFVDSFEAISTNFVGHLADAFVDGLHLSTKGNAAVFRTLMNAIERDTPEVAAASLTAHLPHFSMLERPAAQS